MSKPMVANGRLVQIGVAFKGNNTPNGRKRGYYWAVFQCLCGNKHIAQLYQVQHGRVMSCGCAVHDSENRGTHGKTGTKEYVAWQSLFGRCYRKSCRQFKDYGGRGIIVCDRWHSFENFFEDMGVATEGMSIDRKDNDGPYCKENCRWATRHQQSRNRRSNVLLEINGEIKCVTDWANHYGVSPITACLRIKNGVDPVIAVSLKSNRGKKWNSDHLVQ